jgi:hypothetical protein
MKRSPYFKQAELLLRVLPAVQWKIQNVRRMPANKKAKELENLRRVLKI